MTNASPNDRPTPLVLCRCIGLGLALAGAQFADAALVPVMVRGSATVVLRAESGPVTIILRKRDLNLYDGADELHATLVGPLRGVLATAHIPDDGTPGKGKSQADPQQADIRFMAKRPGLYRLLLRASGDMFYGFETNCDQYLIEGGRITLNNPNEAATLVFAPPAKRPFDVAVAALHEPGLQSFPLRDGAGAVVHTFDVTTRGVGTDEPLFGRKGGGYVAGAKFQVGPESGDFNGLWSLDIARCDVRLGVNGISGWSLSAESWLDVTRTRWMLLPYSATRYLQPGGSADVTFSLWNSTGAAATFDVTAVMSGKADCALVEPGSPVKLDHGASRTVRVRLTASRDCRAGESFEGYVCAAVVGEHGVQASTGLVLHIGLSPVSAALQLPIVLERYRHENAQFGYAPDYVCNEIYFAPDNRPFIGQRATQRYPTKALMVLADGHWQERAFAHALTQTYPSYTGTYMGAGFIGAKVAFDGDGDAYTLLRLLRRDEPAQSVLLHTPDSGQSYTISELPGNSFDIEQFTGHNALIVPPPVLTYTKTADHPATFCSYYDLDLFLPSKREGRLVMGEPITISDRCLGSCQHSGGPASTATRDGRTHVVWGDVAKDREVPGVPTYIATVDHATRMRGEPVFLGYAPPVDDVHNVPAITMDADGFLHVVTGAHGQPFTYRRSLKASDAGGGWTDAVPVLSTGCFDDAERTSGSGRQTYISLVCGPDGALHIAYRQWRRFADAYHGSAMYAALSYQRKPKGEPWGPAQPIVVPPVPGYSIYYHKLTIDRTGRLFLSYNHWTSDTTYQGDFPHRYHHRAIVMSADDGTTWKLLETKNL